MAKLDLWFPLPVHISLHTTYSVVTEMLVKTDTITAKPMSIIVAKNTSDAKYKIKQLHEKMPAESSTRASCKYVRTITYPIQIWEAFESGAQYTSVGHGDTTAHPSLGGWVMPEGEGSIVRDRYHKFFLSPNAAVAAALVQRKVLWS